MGVYTIFDLSILMEDLISQLLFEAGGKKWRLHPFLKQTVSGMSAYIQSKRLEDIEDLNIYSENEFVYFYNDYLKDVKYMEHERYDKNVYVPIKEENGKYIKDLDNIYTKAKFDILCEEYKKNATNQSIVTTNEVSGDNGVLNTLIDRLINDKNNHIKKLLEEEGIKDIEQLPTITEGVIDGLLFISSGRVTSLSNYKKSEVRLLSSYVDSLEDNGKDIRDLDIYSKTDFRKFKKESQNAGLNQSANNNEEMTNVSHNFNLDDKNNASTLSINYVTYDNCPNKNQLGNVSVSSAFVADSHYDCYKEADFHTAVLADGNTFGCKNTNNNNTDCSLINDDSHTNNLGCKYANDDDTDHSLINDDFHDVPFVHQEATKFLDSSMKFEILLYRMIDNHTDAFTKKLYENRIFDIFALGCLSADSIQLLNFNDNKLVGTF